MLPAPIIDGTLPAFYYDELGATAKVVVPFSMSRAVNRNEVKGFSLKIKNLQGSTPLYSITSTIVDYDASQVTFEINKEVLDNKFTLGLFYKAQIAYIDKSNVVGYYSTVGVIKFTSKPILSISGLSSSKNNTHTYTYTGVYNQKAGDPTEKAYSYRFVIRDNQEQIVEDTGYLIHNASSDVEYYESTDTFTYTYDLTTNNKYQITYSVRTSNGVEVEGPTYTIVQKEALPTGSILKIFPKVNHVNGLIEIFFNINPDPTTPEEREQAQQDKLNENYAKGRFILTRSSEDQQYNNWESILEFSLFAQKPSTQSWKDYTVEQGKKYKYSIQQYSKANQLYSKRVVSEIVAADFEDCFLYDGELQLKIKFNPKVASFKKNIFETKIDTIGSKYPFIFRNGQAEYKEFPISGLISYLMDEQSLFGNGAEDFQITQRKYTDVYTPFVWAEHENPVIRKTLRKTQYEREYKYLYIWDSIQAKYINWVDYLKIHNSTYDADLNRFKDFSNYDVYFDKTKSYYTRLTKENKDLNLEQLKVKTTDLKSYNVALERDFKIKVLNWLTNGKPKLFRSPTEGNFIVRLFNVSLTPDDKVGRMLHTFNSTAYEIADFTYQNLKDYGFINTQGFKTNYFKVQSIPLITNDENYVSLSPFKYTRHGDNLWYVDGSLMPPAGQVEYLEIVNVMPKHEFVINKTSIKTGANGHIKIELPITSIELPVAIPFLSNRDIHEQGVLTVGYWTDIDDSFSYISNVEIKEIYGKQFIGEHYTTIPTLKDFVTEPVSYYLIRSYKRKLDTALVDLDIRNFSAEEFEEKIIPINLYQYNTEENVKLGPLYRRVNFGTLNFYDSMYPESAARDPEYRSTHPALIDEKDFDLYVNSGRLFYYSIVEDSIKTVTPDIVDTLEGPFFIKEVIENIFDPQDSTKHYFTNDTYILYWNLFQTIKQLNTNSNFAVRNINTLQHDFLIVPYTVKFIFDDNTVETIDLTETKYHQLKDFVDIKDIAVSAGVYLELTYTVQIVKYDVSRKGSLMQLEKKLDACLEILSKDGMRMFAARNPEKNYLDMAYQVMNGFSTGNIYMGSNGEVAFDQGDSYKRLYSQYLTQLQSYISSLEEYEKGGRLV